MRQDEENTKKEIIPYHPHPLKQSPQEEIIDADYELLEAIQNSSPTPHNQQEIIPYHPHTYTPSSPPKKKRSFKLPLQTTGILIIGLSIAYLSIGQFKAAYHSIQDWWHYQPPWIEVETPAGTNYHMHFSEYQTLETPLLSRTEQKAYAQHQWDGLLSRLEKFRYERDKTEKLLDFVANIDNFPDPQAIDTDAVEFMRLYLTQQTKAFREFKNSETFSNITKQKEEKTKSLEQWLRVKYNRSTLLP
jgi:hypothetical protein